MAAADKSLALAPGEGAEMALGPNRLTWKAVGEETGGAYAMMELVTVPGSGSPYHIHYNEDESFYMLEGTLTIYLDDRLITASPGSFIFIPRGLRHAFVNRGAEPATALVTVSPAGLEGFFAALADPEHPLDNEGFAALARQYRIEFQGPPPDPAAA